MALGVLLLMLYNGVDTMEQSMTHALMNSAPGGEPLKLKWLRFCQGMLGSWMMGYTRQ